MSFILDALKKSEAERQRQNSPGIASIPESERPGGSRKWTWVLSALLVVNLAVLAVVMLRPTTNQQPVADPQANTGRSEPPQQPAVARPAPQVARVPRSAPEPAAQQALPVPVPVTAAVEEVAIPETAPAERVSTGLPTLNELQSQGVLQLPEMHLDIHVFSGQPAERFVFVNMKKYTEGGTLTEGPAVREITGDGVVLDYQGTRFLLPRE